MICWFDCETFSEVPIRNGTYAYAASCEITIATYAYDDGPIHTWDALSGQPMPGDLEYTLRDDDCLLYAHNVIFDRNVLRLSRNVKIETDITRWRCSLVQALAHSLPGKLDTLCTILGVGEDEAKMKSGHDLMMLFCKPRPKNSVIKRATNVTHPEQWQGFLDYARHDISAMRRVSQRLPVWNYRGAELALWHLDQRINDRGFQVDTDLARAAVEAVGREQRRLSREVQVATDQEIGNATQRDALLAYILAEYGVALPDMQKDTLERRVDDPDLPIELRELLAIRLQATTSSTSKYAALLRGVGPDGRLRGTMQFDGASRTGRWAHRNFQPGNTPRQTLSQDVINEGIRAIKANCVDLV